MEKQGQGAIEYLLIIGAAIIVVAIVVIMLAGILTNTDQNTDDATQSITDGYKTLGCEINTVDCACVDDTDCEKGPTGQTCKDIEGLNKCVAPTA